MSLGDHECHQEVNLARLTMATETLVKSVDQLTRASQEQIKITQIMAEQGARIDATEGRVSKLEHDTDGIYDRVRGVELFQAKRQAGIEIEDNEQKDTKNFRNTVKAMLLVAIIISSVTALFWLLDKNDYVSGITKTVTTTRGK